MIFYFVIVRLLGEIEIARDGYKKALRHVKSTDETIIMDYIKFENRYGRFSKIS